MIETDHTGVIARRRMFDIADARDVSVFSGHTGEVSSTRDSNRILEIGGIASNLTDEPTPVTISFIQDIEAACKNLLGNTDGLATGHGSDINGIHNQPPPHDGAASNPLIYPFRFYDDQVTFQCQTTGDHVSDLDVDGVSHYG